MKALVLHGKRDLRIGELPQPEPSAGEVRIRVAYVGVCGSDLHYYNDGANGAFVVREPLVPGHEVSAVVDLDPSGELEPGTPVTVHPAGHGTTLEGIEDRPHLWPGGSYLGSASTWPHTQGGMAEYLVLKKSMLRVLPDGVSVRTAALAEPLAVALHGIALAGGVQGKKVLVCGAGPIGLLAAAATKALGASEVAITDVIDSPLSRARALGIETTFNVREEAAPPISYDLVLECSGAAASVSAAFVAVKHAGTVIQLGMLPNEPRGVVFAPMLSKEVTFIGSFRFNDEIDEALTLLAEHPEIADVITHVVPADDAERAFAVAGNAAESGKVVVSIWWDEG